MFVNLVDASIPRDGGPETGAGRRLSPWDDAAVDTVEWGSGRTPAESLTGPPSDRQPADRAWVGWSLNRVAGRWAAVVLAALGVGTLVGSEFLPWARLNTGGASSGGNPASSAPDVSDTSFGLDQLNSIGSFAYRLGLLAVLALVGAVLFARPRQRRVLAGVAVGIVAAEALSLISLIRSLSHLFGDGVTSRQSSSFHVGVEPGPYLAAVGLLLLLGSVVLSAAPAQVRAQFADAMREPVDAHFTDQPMELTVTQVKPIDEAYYTRPDLHRR
jgi:hypothetical protein